MLYNIQTTSSNHIINQSQQPTLGITFIKKFKQYSINFSLRVTYSARLALSEVIMNGVKGCAIGAISCISVSQKISKMVSKSNRFSQLLLITSTVLGALVGHSIGCLLGSLFGLIKGIALLPLNAIDGFIKENQTTSLERMWIHCFKLY
ncbi:MAG: hypothetical protein HAW62_03940 [Endozoicomonadaceae bacterium]|nr:hypothetical protein [Endozoicomonadaceae bacterium]